MEKRMTLDKLVIDSKKKKKMILATFAQNVKLMNM